MGRFFHFEIIPRLIFTYVLFGIRPRDGAYEYSYESSYSDFTDITYSDLWTNTA